MTGTTPTRPARPGSRRHRLRRALWYSGIGIALTVVLTLTAAWIVGGLLIAPAQRTVGPPPAGLVCETVCFPSTSGSTISGWLCAGPADSATVILLHGLRGDRRACMGRVPFLRRAGYATLCIDLQGHGESQGELMTFGHRESDGVRAAVDFVRRLWPQRQIALLGQSLGGAACLLGESSEAPPAVDAVILEQVYACMADAAANRVGLFLGGLGATLLGPLLTMQCDLRLGISADQLRPEVAITRLLAPVFVLGGAADRRTPPAETRRLFAAARGAKELWIVPHAGHGNLHAVAGVEYERRVLAFLEQHLRRS